MTLRRDRVSAAAVPVAFVAANLLSYLLLLVAAHRLRPGAYGELSSLLGLLLIATVPMSAIQTVAARRAASGTTSAGLLRTAVLVSVAATALLCAASAPLAGFLHLHGVLGVLLVAAAVPPHVALGVATGLAQGSRRFTTLAWLLLAATGLRSLGGLLGLLATGTVTGAIGGSLIGSAVAAAGVLGPLARQTAPYSTAADSTAADSPDGGTVAVAGWRDGDPFAESMHAAHGHGAFLLLTGLGVLLARHVLSGPDGGVFAVGSVLTKAAVWLPQSVVLLVFASLAQDDRHLEAARRAVVLVLGLGAVAVVGSAVLGRALVSAIGGSRYHVLDHTVWLFAALGALLAVLQLAVLAGLARRDRRRIAVLWAAVALQSAAALVLGRGATPVSLVVALDVVAALAAVVACWLLLGVSVPRRTATATA